MPPHDEDGTDGNSSSEIHPGHPHSDGNMGETREPIEKFKNAYTTLIERSKYSAFLGSFFGLLYLFSYTVTESIPFPLELSVLPTLLIAVGLIALFFVLIIVTGLLIPFMAQADTSNVEFLSLFVEVDKAGQILKVKPLGERLTHYSFAFFPTIITTFVSWNMFVQGLPMASIIPLIIVSVGFWVIYSVIVIWQYPILIVSSDKTFFSKSASLFWTLLHTNLLSLLSLLWFCIFAAYAFPEFFKGKDALVNNYPISTFLLILLFFFILNALSVMPIGRFGKLMSSPRDGKPTIKLSTPIPMVPLFLLAVATLGSVVYPPASHRMGGAALRVLGIGGGLAETLCFKSGRFPDALRELESSTQFDCTCGVWVIFDAGNTIYVKASDIATKVYAIKKEEISIQYRDLAKPKK